MATTYNNLYLDIRQQLRRAGIEEATLEARELVCFGTNKSREELARDGGLYASPELEHRVRDLVRRHLEGEPVAYLIGEWEFYGLPLDISRDVLIPRPDTEVLAEQAIGYIKTLGECRVLDLCAGSGCIGLAVAAQVPQARVVLGEWSDGALKICRQNVRRNSLTARVVPMQADAREKPEKSLGEFQCIVSNPPYIPRADIETLDTSVMLITHDLGVVREVCSRAIIFYCGQVIEEGPVEELFENPCHPYTQGLLKSLPVMGSRERLYVIPGTVPSPGNLPEGCVFNPRCGHATEKCRSCRPQMTDISDGHRVRCWLYDKEG